MALVFHLALLAHGAPGLDNSFLVSFLHPLLFQIPVNEELLKRRFLALLRFLIVRGRLCGTRMNFIWGLSLIVIGWVPASAGFFEVLSWSVDGSHPSSRSCRSNSPSKSSHQSASPPRSLHQLASPSESSRRLASPFKSSHRLASPSKSFHWSVGPLKYSRRSASPSKSSHWSGSPSNSSYWSDVSTHLTYLVGSCSYWLFNLTHLPHQSDSSSCSSRLSYTSRLGHRLDKADCSSAAYGWSSWQSGGVSQSSLNAGASSQPSSVGPNQADRQNMFHGTESVVHSMIGCATFSTSLLSRTSRRLYSFRRGESSSGGDCFPVSFDCWMRRGEGFWCCWGSAGLGRTYNHWLL